MDPALSEFENKFIMESVIFFHLSYSRSKEILEKIVNNNFDGNRLFKYILNLSCGSEEQKIQKTIPVFEQCEQKQQFIDCFQYHCLLGGLFVQTLKKVNHKFFVNINKIHFMRVIIDCDIDCGFDGKNVLKNMINFLKDCTKNSSYIITQRLEKNNDSFHLISEEQYDAISASKIIDIVKTKFSSENVKIDKVVTWCLPGGRSHIPVNEEKLNWDIFKKMSCIDVWSKNNFFCFWKTILSNDSTGEIISFQSENGSKFKYVVDEEINYCSKKKIFVDYQNFFSSFENNFYTVDLTISKNFLIKCTDLYDYVRKEFTYSKKNDVDEEAEIEDYSETPEFTDCFYEAKITIKNKLAQILNVKFEKETVIDLENLGNQLENISELYYFDETNEKKIAINFLNKTQVFPKTYSKNRIESNFEKHNNLKWNRITKALSVWLFNQDEFLIPMIVYFYRIYTFNHNLENYNEPEYYNTMLNLLAKKHDVYFSQKIADFVPEFKIDPTLCSNLTVIDDIFEITTGKILKHILKIMLDNCCTTSVLSMFIRANIFNDTKLICSVCALYNLTTSSTAKNILLSYISDSCESNISSIEKQLRNCFYNNDIIYFLSDFYNQSAQNMMIKFLLFFDLKSNEETTLKKKRKSKNVQKSCKNGSECVFKTFVRYIVCLKRNECFTYIYEKNEFVMYFNGIEVIDSYIEHATEVELESVYFNFWYRRDPGIFFAITSQHELHLPSLFSLIKIQTHPSLKHFGFQLFDAQNFNLKTFIFETLLKGKSFIEICNLNKLFVVLLGPTDKETTFTHYIENVRIVKSDLNDVFISSCVRCFVEKNGYLNYAIQYLYLILCALSKFCNFSLNPAWFISETDISLVNDAIENNESESNLFCNLQKITQKENLSIFEITMKNAFSDLYKENQKFEAEDKIEEKAEILTDLTFTENGFGNLNSFALNRFFNSLYDKKELFVNSDIDISDNCFSFCLIVISWYVRMGQDKEYSKTKFFKFIYLNREVIYKELVDLMIETCGVLMINEDIKHLFAYFKAYCKNTIVTIPEHLENLSPPGYNFNRQNLYEGKLEDFVYFGVVGFISNSQFMVDYYVDLLKILNSFTYPGNRRRKMLALLNRTGTGKSEFVQFILDVLFKTKSQQSFTNEQFQKNDKDTGNILAGPMNSNLVVWFDEVTKLNEATRSIINTGILIERNMFQKKNATFRIHSHVIISANNDPLGGDDATNHRMLPFDRKMQYVQLDSNFKHCKRTSGVDDIITKKVNNLLGIQLLLEKLPTDGERGLEECGTFLMIWLCRDAFFFKFTMPVSYKLSKTVNDRLLKFLFKAQPGLFLIRNKLIKFSPNQSMSMIDFKTASLNLMRQHFGQVSTTAIDELTDMLTKFKFENRMLVTVG